ncbi:dipeptidase PepV [Jeotgalibaca ciconiae]|uniref:Dipeptidase PepV n=1 Tax=Jeotgalibaca ciconiae TaxID=2496265 RepID=A0A3S9HDV4_9LACT|nr:dipeptidase PepV [Jeotgalibaca ciconiae]AZP05534.1 dipeptidase PepV [Jeotgalibaca ciconiae]HJB22619.1 dipeptidase PepV [Candidatus Jeotgalibaca pullicola]
MEINWKNEVEKRKQDLLDDLFTILKVDSIRDDSRATPEMPVGPGPKEALEAFLAIGERDGFITKNVGNLAGHIEYGEGEELMGVFGHVDVVPTGSGWDTDPFDPIIKNERIYARGSSDDKGPSMAAYYAIKIIRDLGLPISKRVRMIIGTDEESGWQCMDHYLANEETPAFGFSPDADFPIINGEKGNQSLYVKFRGNNEGGKNRLVSFDAGLRENMVPQDATAIFTSEEAEKIEKDFFEFVENNPVTGTIEVEDNKVSIQLVGKASHGMNPAGGINAGTYLAVFLNQYSFGGEAANFFRLINDYIHLEHTAEKLGLAYTDEVMGELTMNAGVFTFTPEDGGTIALNFRYPVGVTAEALEIKTEAVLSEFGVTIAKNVGKLPHYVPADDSLVKTLLDVYEKHTGLKGKERSIGGGTYGRLLERGVAYGALFPDSIDTMHQANEFFALDDLFRATAIYADAIYQLLQ